MSLWQNLARRLATPVDRPPLVAVDESWVTQALAKVDADLAAERARPVRDIEAINNLLDRRTALAPPVSTRHPAPFTPGGAA